MTAKEWFAISPGPVGDHVAVSTTSLSFADALDQARELSRTTGRPHRVIRLTEIAHFAIGRTVK